MDAEKVFCSFRSAGILARLCRLELVGFSGLNKKTYLNMKKLFLAMGVVAMLAGLSSCSKNCVCKQYMNGELMQTTTVEGKGKCSDLNVKQEVMGMVNETKCENE